MIKDKRYKINMNYKGKCIFIHFLTVEQNNFKDYSMTPICCNVIIVLSIGKCHLNFSQFWCGLLSHRQLVTGVCGCVLQFTCFCVTVLFVCML